MQNLIESKIQPEELDRFRRLAADYFLSDFIPMMEPLLKRSIVVTYGEPDDYTQVGNSRLGGWPDAPAGFKWPRSSTGKYMHMVFQLNLADIASMQAILPASGVMQFFLGGEPDRVVFEPEAQILYHPEHLPLNRFELPPETQIDDYSWCFWGGGDPVWYEDSGGAEPLSDEPYQVHFHPALALPGPDSDFYQVEGYKNFEEYIDANLNISEEESDKGDYFDMVQDLNVPPEFDEIPNNSHSLLGYELWEHTAYNFHHQDAEGEDAKTKVPFVNMLFQIDPIYYDGFRHGWLACTEGTYSFLVPRKNIEKADFSRVYIDLI